MSKQERQFQQNVNTRETILAKCQDRKDNNSNKMPTYEIQQFQLNADMKGIIYQYIRAKGARKMSIHETKKHGK